MVIDAESAFQAVCIVLENNEGKKAAIGSLQSCLVTAVSTFAGSLAGGPKGIIPGALLGALFAFSMKKDSYKSIVEVIQQDLSLRQKEELARNVQNVISSFNVVDVAMLMNMAAGNADFQSEILGCVHSFLESTAIQSHALNN